MSAHATRSWKTPVGLGAAVVGVLLAVYGYTPPRIYHIGYFYMTAAGFLLVFVGVVLAAWARATKGMKRAPKPAPAAGAAAATKATKKASRKSADKSKRAAGASDASPFAAFVKRPHDAAAAGEAAGGRAASGAQERITLDCPKCATRFTVVGTRPIAVSCPKCRHSGTLK